MAHMDYFGLNTTLNLKWWVHRYINAAYLVITQLVGHIETRSVVISSAIVILYHRLLTRPGASRGVRITEGPIPGIRWNSATNSPGKGYVMTQLGLQGGSIARDRKRWVNLHGNIVSCHIRRLYAAVIGQRDLGSVISSSVIVIGCILRCHRWAPIAEVPRPIVTTAGPR